MDGLQEFCKLLLALVMLGVCESFWRGLWFVLDYQRYHALKKVETSLVIPKTELTRPSHFCPSMAEHLERQIVFMGHSSMATKIICIQTIPGRRAAWLEQNSPGKNGEGRF